MSNVSSLGDMRKKEKQAAAEGKQNELFIGGIDQKGGGSGLAVIGPPGGVPGGPPLPSRPDTFDRIFERAQDRSEDDSESAPREEGGSRRVITMYRNGFVVDDGPFRDATSPENQLFIRSLEAGRVPVEMSRGATDDIEVSLNDKRQEDYVAPPPPAYVAFSKGTTLGGSSAAGSSGAWVSTPDGSSNCVKVDDSQPSSTLQIRTPDGKRILVKLNNNATVLHLAAAIRSQWAGGAGASFTLSSGFPPKELTSSGQTLSEAGLVGSSVTLKII